MSGILCVSMCTDHFCLAGNNDKGVWQEEAYCAISLYYMVTNYMSFINKIYLGFAHCVQQ
jgi:hypothetical protein